MRFTDADYVVLFYQQYMGCTTALSFVSMVPRTGFTHLGIVIFIFSLFGFSIIGTLTFKKWFT